MGDACSHCFDPGLTMRLRPLVHGAALAGAGGGGFLFCVTKEPDAADAVLIIDPRTEKMELRHCRAPAGSIDRKVLSQIRGIGVRALRYAATGA